MTFWQKERPEGRDFRIIYIKVTHKLLRVNGAVPWGCPTYGRLRDGPSFVGAAENPLGDQEYLRSKQGNTPLEYK